MWKNNEEILKKAEEHVELHDSQRLPRLKVKYDNGHLTEVRYNKNKGGYDRDKSIIGVAAQLQNLGATNAVCIKHNDYLNQAKIVSNHSCKEIWHAFESLITSSIHW